MQYQIPQFIESETKIVGPLSGMQFGLIGGAAAVIVILYFTTKSILLTLLAVILIGAPAFALAFVKYNGEKLPSVIAHALNYFQKPKIYTWQKTGEGKISLKEIERIVKKKEKIVKRKGESKLQKLAWELQTGRR